MENIRDVLTFYGETVSLASGNSKGVNEARANLDRDGGKRAYAYLSELPESVKTIKELQKIVEALDSYSKNVEGCRKITSEGDTARQTLIYDAGYTAKQALQDSVGLAYMDVLSASFCAFQKRTEVWVSDIGFSNNVRVRALRFLEEAMELVQSVGLEKEDSDKLSSYVFSRPTGVPFQEIGGVATTLAALCSSANISLAHATNSEIARIESKKDIIKTKEASKPTFS